MIVKRFFKAVGQLLRRKWVLLSNLLALALFFTAIGNDWPAVIIVVPIVYIVTGGMIRSILNHRKAVEKIPFS